MTPGIEDLKDLQKRLGLSDTHVIYIGDDSFVIAHTDTERITIILNCCPLHTWLTDQRKPPAKVGYYTAVFNEKWKFTPLDPTQAPSKPSVSRS